MNENKLFESGCCLCGRRDNNDGTLVPLAQCRDNACMLVCVGCVEIGEGWGAADREITRRRAALAAEHKGAEARFYGAQPDVLPKTLPAGTKVSHSEPSPGYYAATGELVLVQIDWSTVPIQAPSPTAPQPTEAKREDPYVEHRRAIAAKFGYAPDVTAELLDYQVAWATKGRAELTRSAAFPSREPPPRVPVEHPAAFPADAFLDAWTCDP